MTGSTAFKQGTRERKKTVIPRLVSQLPSTYVVRQLEAMQTSQFVSFITSNGKGSSGLVCVVRGKLDDGINDNWPPFAFS